MIYNISFELASLFFLAIMYINFVTQYSREAKKVKINRHFKYLIILGFMDNFWDVLSAVTISYYQSIPVWANMIISSVYFMFGAAFAYSFVSYVEKTVLKSVNKFFHMFNLCVFVIYEISIAIGIFFDYYVWFDKVLGYQHGPLYLLLFSMPLYFSFCSAVYIFAQSAQMDRRKLVATASYLVISFAGILMQVFCFTDVLLSGFGGAVALFIVFFSIETPDYHKLVATMEELEESRRVAEEERTRADIANQAKSKFLAKMSHEIRTPINTIIGMNEMVIRESTEDEVLQYATDIKHSSEVLLSIINEILDASKIESGKMEIIPVEYHSERLLSDLYNMIDVKAKDKNLNLVFDIDPTIPVKLYGDDIRIRQIMMNLLTNAVKYTMTGTVTLKVKCIAEDASLQTDNITLQVSVIDTGVGIKEEDMHKLFSEFDRINDKKIRYEEGTGLGISIATQLLALMDSKLNVSSTYGEGSNFSFIIKQGVIDKEPIGNFTKKKEEPVSNTKKPLFIAPNARVLVVDDSSTNRTVFRGLLKYHQIQVTAVASGKVCLDVITKKHFDIIFLDHMMPEMDGLETFERMKKLDNNLCKDTPIIMLTANAIKGSKEKYLEAGFDGYLSKPIIPEQLSDLVREYLANKIESTGL